MAQLKEIAEKLGSIKELSNTQAYSIKGGCSVCEDGRRPPAGGIEKTEKPWWHFW